MPLSGDEGAGPSGLGVGGDGPHERAVVIRIVVKDREAATASEAA
jgi:hypothetical protein